MRADLYLAEYRHVDGRSEAKRAIEAGLVTIDGKPVTKPGAQVDENREHSVVIADTGTVRYASRGGIKLEHALDTFAVSPEGRVALDIGASGGGFTDLLLRRGASLVYALDCGSGQLAPRLREDARVVVLENYNARYLDKADFEPLPELLTMDVSFISQTMIFPAINALLPNGFELVSLIKPQFEVGRAGVGKGGIVRDEKTRQSAIDRVRAAAELFGWKTLGVTVSPITGGDGNVEYLAWFRKDGAGKESL